MVDLRMLATDVQTILADPQADVPAPHDPALTGALAALRRQRRMHRPLVEPHVDGYWHAPIAAHADGH